MLIDTSSNTKIVYLFVNNFEWTAAANKEIALGHPKNGRVYRAVKNTDSESYRIMYPINNTFQGTYLSTLKESNSENGYVSDIQEIEIGNILDFNILEDDLTQFVRWIEIDNSDLKGAFKQFFEKQSNPLGSMPRQLNKKDLLAVVVGALRGTDPEMASVVSTISELRSVEPQIYAALGVFVNHILANNEPETSIDSRWIRFDKTLGAGANLSSAVQRLSSYGSSDRRKNFSENDLMEAIKDLFLETYRLKSHKDE